MKQGDTGNYRSTGERIVTTLRYVAFAVLFGCASDGGAGAAALCANYRECFPDDFELQYASELECLDALTESGSCGAALSEEARCASRLNCDRLGEYLVGAGGVCSAEVRTTERACEVDVTAVFDRLCSRIDMCAPGFECVRSSYLAALAGDFRCQTAYVEDIECVLGVECGSLEAEISGVTAVCLEKDTARRDACM